MIRPAWLFVIVWIGWAVSWAAAAFWSDHTAKRLATWDVWVSRVIVAVSLILFSHSVARLLGAQRLWHVGLNGAYALAGLTLAGIIFAWWARLHLGRLWSSAVAVKAGHHIVDSGPYGLVRHPIYTGLLAASLATAVAKATVPAMAGWVLLVLGLWLKARAEEGFLAVELDQEAYSKYRRRIPMLVPFMSRGG
jgi:protein-S-isoprenylcysteine O-methyltransferase Ste14